MLGRREEGFEGRERSIHRGSLLSAGGPHSKRILPGLAAMSAAPSYRSSR